MTYVGTSKSKDATTKIQEGRVPEAVRPDVAIKIAQIFQTMPKKEPQKFYLKSSAFHKIL